MQKQRSQHNPTDESERSKAVSVKDLKIKYIFVIRGD